jgi:hypothetical protein
MSDGLNNFFQSFSGKLGNALGNPSAQKKPGIPTSGPTRNPFLDPTTLLSSVYLPTNGDSRTSSGGPFQNGSTSPLLALEEDRTKSAGGTTYNRQRKQQPGFTPLNYYRTATGEKFIAIPSNLRNTNERFSEILDDYDKFGDERASDFKFSLKDYVRFFGSENGLEAWDGGPGGNPWESNIDQNPSKLSSFSQTPYDNEDPVWFGFEIILNVNSSPLLNGELEKFIDNPSIGGSVTEIGSRLSIVNQFKNELIKYFKLDTNLQIGDRYDPANNIIATDLYGVGSSGTRRGYYVKKIAGLDKLVEANEPGSLKSFVDYGKDNLTITFYEDTTLNLGTLASLYKLMYWSRLRGKNIIPENLLRFDCEIIVSELRDFVRLKKSGNMLEYLRSNLSRYRYQLFECQFFFNKMSHPESIDMYGITETNDYDVQMSFKYSNMIFERYDPSKIDYVRLRNGTQDPLATNTPDLKIEEKKLGEWTNLSGGFTMSANQNNFTSPIENQPDPTAGQLLNDLKQNQKNSIYNLLKAPNPSANPGTQKDDIFGRAAGQLVENIKKAALNEAQRQLNIRFRLLNNAIDDIRNSFGIGRIPAPTNVYFPAQNGGPYGNSQFFFDVKNSLRNFGGDTLTGLIGGG